MPLAAVRTSPSAAAPARSGEDARAAVPGPGAPGLARRPVPVAPAAPGSGGRFALESRLPKTAAPRRTIGEPGRDAAPGHAAATAAALRGEKA